MSIEHPHIREYQRKGHLGKAPASGEDYFGNEIQKGDEVLVVGSEELVLISEATAHELIQLMTDLGYAEVKEF